MLPPTDLCLGDVMDRHVLTVSGDCTLASLLPRLRDRQVSQIIVEQAGVPAGMLTERDLMRVLHRQQGLDRPIAQVMSSPVATVPCSVSFRAAYVQLCLSRLRHLVVVDAAQKVVGIASERDFLGHVGLELFQSVQRLEPLVDWSISSMDAATPVMLALERMLHEKRGCIIVNDGAAPIGLFTEHQAPAALARILEGSPVTLGDVMQHCPVIFSTDASVAEVLRQLVSERVGYVIVAKGQSGAAGIIAQSRLLESVRTSIHVEVANRQLAQEQIQQAQQALQQQLDFSGAVVDAMLDGVSVCHETDAPPHIHFTMWNAAMVQLTGYTLAEINQLGWYQTVYTDPATQERARQRMARMRLGDNLAHEEWVITRKDGEQRRVEITTSLVLPPGAKPHVMAVMRDTTARQRTERQLRDSEANFRAFFNTIDDFLFVLDLTGKMLFVNKTVLDRLGYPESSLLGQSVLSVHPPPRREEAGRIVAAMLAGQADFCPVPLMTASGRLIPVETRVVQGSWNGEAALFGVSRDVTERLRIAQALQDEADRRKILFEQTRDGIVLLRTDGSLAECNPAFAESLGYSLAELASMHVWDWDHLLSRQQLEAEFQKPDLHHLTTETQHRRKNGSLVDVEVRVNDVELAGERYFFCIHQDITERKLAQQQMRESEFFLLESQRIGQLGGFRADPKRNSVNWTEGIYNICELPLDYKPDLKSGLDAYVESSRELVATSLQRVVDTGTSFTLQVQVRGARTGQLKWTELRGFPHRDANGNVDYVMGTLQDISERKGVEEALAIAKEDAEAANRAKSAFLATMSHEIRTPMNGVLGMAQLLLTSNLSETDRYSYARTILTSGQTLLTLLNDILDLSKIEAGKFQLEQRIFDPASLVAETQNLFAGAAQTKQLQLDCRWRGVSEQRYAADPSRIRQMLSNLVGNAIKFTPRGSVRMEGREIARDAQTAMLEFAVTDSGIGVAAENRDLLFKPFSQADGSTTREFGGTGLGLSIVSNLAKAMGGEAGVDSQPGIGSRFWFRIRASLADEQHERRQAEREGHAGMSAGSATPKFMGWVLVVEDNPVNCLVIEALLAGMGLTLTTVRDGQQALDALQRGDVMPDLILMDIQMPVMDGYTATQRIRQWEADSHRTRIPIIALTADAFEEDHQHCLAVGMDDFLTKPISLATLQRALFKWVRQQPAQPAPVLAPRHQDKRLDQQQFLRLVDELIALLERNGFDAFDKLTELQRCVAGTGLESGTDAVGELLQAFRFDAALLQLRQVLAQHRHEADTAS